LREDHNPGVIIAAFHHFMRGFKNKQQPASITSSLVQIKEMAQLIRLNQHSPGWFKVRMTSLLEKQEGKPAPLIALFDWAQFMASRDQSWEPFRDRLYELITLCFRIHRHYDSVSNYPDLARVPFDEVAITDRLESLVNCLSHSNGNLALTG
jgi:hypothetical protein